MNNLQRTLVTCFLLALSQGLIFLFSQISLTGFLAFPLDDTYIHLQYAKQIAHGAYFQYQDGQPITSGATSFLYAHLLAFGYLIGFRGTLFILLVHAVALVSVTSLYVSLVRIGARLAFPALGWLTVILLTVSGWMGWAFWSGMEIALFCALLAGAVDLALDDAVPPNYFWTVLGFLALCRPEGAIFGVVLTATLAALRLTPLQTNRVNALLSYQRAMVFFAVALILPSLFFQFTTGSAATSGLLAKGLLYHPAMTRIEQISEIVSNAAAIFLFFIGHSSETPGFAEFTLPFTLFIALAGAGAISLHADRNKRWYGLAVLLPLLAALFSVCAIEAWRLHSYRYVLPFVPLLYLLGLFGIHSILQWLRLHDRRCFLACWSVAALLYLSTLPVWVARYSEHAETIAEKQIRAAKWINNNLPDDRPVAINDAGALAYYGGHEIYDFVGLVTPNAAVVYRMGEAGIYENLTRLPQDRRPVYAAVFSSWFEESSQTYDVFHQPAVYFPDPFDPGFGKTVYRVNWDYAGMEVNPRANTMREGWVVRDFIDVADVVSEKEHGYRVELRGGEYPKIPIPLRRNFGYNEEVKYLWSQIDDARDYLIPLLRRQGILNQFDIVDGGRRIDGAESFTLTNLTPGQPLYLVTRTCEDYGDRPRFHYRVGIYADGLFTGETEMEGTPWNWYEKVIEIPARFIKNETAHIRVKNLGTPDFAYYTSFYYWACQSTGGDS